MFIYPNCNDQGDKTWLLSYPNCNIEVGLYQSKNNYQHKEASKIESTVTKSFLNNKHECP